MAKPKPIPFFTDHNVPDSVGKAIVGAGHVLQRLRECMPSDTKDPVIAIACARAGQVLVSHDNDFKAIAKRLNLTKSQYLKSLHRIDLRCPEPEGARRILDAMSLIEHEWRRSRKSKEPMVIEIKDALIRVLR